MKSAPERASKSQSEIELPLRRPSLPHPLPSRFSLAFAACSVVFCLGRKVPFLGLSPFRDPFTYCVRKNFGFLDRSPLSLSHSCNLSVVSSAFKPIPSALSADVICERHRTCIAGFFLCHLPSFLPSQDKTTKLSTVEIDFDRRSHGGGNATLSFPALHG